MKRHALGKILVASVDVKPEVWDVQNGEVRGQVKDRAKSVFPDSLFYRVIGFGEFGDLKKSTSYRFDYSRCYLMSLSS